MRTKLSPTFVASATALPGAERPIYWDDDLPGFGLQVTAAVTRALSASTAPESAAAAWRSKPR